MIVELNIRNFAIIDDLKIKFTEGFNVITGETGAGKSIIVEGMGMILGGRASKELIKTGKNKATIEGLFYLKNPQEINKILKDYGIDIDPNNYLLVSREIYSDGPSISRLNGRTVTLSMLNNITSKLVDIHGQSEHLSLLDTSNHIKIIDSFGDASLFDLIKKVEELYRELHTEEKMLENLSMDARERDREIDLLTYQLHEIDDGDLYNYNEDEVLNEYNKISNIRKIIHNLGEIVDILNSNDYTNISILDRISEMIIKINNIKDFDSNLMDYYDTLVDINFQLQDLSRDIAGYMETLELNQDRLNFLEERIDTVNNLKRKYGNTIEEILVYRTDIENRINTLINIEKEIENSNKKIKRLKEELSTYCNQLTDLRKQIGNKLEELITQELRDLNMENVVFKIQYNKLDNFSPNGWDKIEFLISTNKGQDLKPLSKIVSGGEVSRIMLAFKSILAGVDNIPCLIFDEIDTGISGRTAQKVGEKIKKISKGHQIISISHLPQLAALADTHFLIEKGFNNSETYTRVKKLNTKERIDELARLLGGVDLTETTRLHAKEMLSMSQNLK